MMVYSLTSPSVSFGVYCAKVSLESVLEGCLGILSDFSLKNDRIIIVVEILILNAKLSHHKRIGFIGRKKG